MTGVKVLNMRTGNPNMINSMTMVFLISNHPYIDEMLPVAEYMVRMGHNVVVALDYGGDRGRIAEQRCSARGLAVKRTPDEINFGATAGLKVGIGSMAVAKKSLRFDEGEKVPKKIGALSQLKEKIKVAKSKLGRASLLIINVAIFIKRKNKLFEFLDEINPNIIFHHDSGSNGRSPDFILSYRKKRKNVKIAFIPCTPYIGEKDRVSARFMTLSDGACPPTIHANYDIINKFIALIFPSWLRHRSGDSLFPFDPVDMVAARLAGGGLKNGWQVPPEGFDWYFVFDEKSKQRLIDSDISEEKIIISGQPLIDDAIFSVVDDRKREEVFKKIGIESNSDFILMNIDPGIDQGYETREKHEYKIGRIISSLNRYNLPVVASLHPACRIENYKFVLDRGVLIPKDVKIHSLFPFCLFSTSFFCSTNRISEIFGKKMVVFHEGISDSDRTERLNEYVFDGSYFCSTYEELDQMTDLVFSIAKTEKEKMDVMMNYTTATSVIHRYVAE